MKQRRDSELWQQYAHRLEREVAGLTKKLEWMVLLLEKVLAEAPPRIHAKADSSPAMPSQQG